ncbi:MAG: GDP-mannose 4,6-dehydratase [bacterium]|nr:GDP-mannose 4,6-dehydratase [bacterium]
MNGRFFDSAPDRVTLITGGAGFIGTNLAHRLLAMGERVIVYDNLSRAGVDHNLRWLQRQWANEQGGRLQVETADIRDLAALRRALAQADSVYHFAAQVAVTTSLYNPLHDFEVNARGTLDLLELMRGLPTPPALIFTSTNKVYGGLDDLALRIDGQRYQPAPGSRWTDGVSEAAALDFHSPYGCSKGIADQYVLDYARSYGLATLVFRMSCIYGTHQFGTEDQGWVAHFVKCALNGTPLVLYGDGRQVRDLLFVDDLVDAFVLARQHMPSLKGKAYNIGGGAAHTTSLLDLIALFSEIGLSAPPVRFSAWRSGDQRWYVTDHERFAAAVGWKPRIGIREGVARLRDWLVTPETAYVGARTAGALAHSFVQQGEQG